MATKYKLPYTGEELNEKLEKIDNVLHQVIDPDNYPLEIVKDEEDNITGVKAYGGGFGHGVGMSQYGAGFMAKELHMPYDKIIKHYYTGVSLTSIPLILSAHSTQREYTQNIFIEQNGRLKKLDKEFESEELNYIVVIDNEVENIVIDIEKIDPQSTYEIIGANNLEVGENEVKVISKARDNSTTTTYTLTVVRQAYSNTYLSSLSVDKGTLDPEFNKETLSYEVNVDYDDREITIDAVAENNEAIVSGTGLKNLKVGLNEFEIEVNKNGIRRKYIVKVTRDGSHNANIINITSDLGLVEKISDTKYKLTVANEVSEILSRNIKYKISLFKNMYVHLIKLFLDFSLELVLI